MGPQILVPKKGNIPLYTQIALPQTMFLLNPLSPGNVCFQVRKHTLLIVNHSKTKATLSLDGFYSIDDHQHVSMELLGVPLSLQGHLLCR